MTGEMTTIRQWQREVHRLAREKGWWPDDGAPITTESILAKLALVHSEVSESVEAARVGELEMHVKDGKPEGMAVELADAVIRILDLCEALDLDLHGAIENKHSFNRTRSHRHGGKLA